MKTVKQLRRENNLFRIKLSILLLRRAIRLAGTLL